MYIVLYDNNNEKFHQHCTAQENASEKYLKENMVQLQIFTASDYLQKSYIFDNN